VVDRALGRGVIVAAARGRYSSPCADAAVRAAHRLKGVLCRESAALFHGWAVSHVPERPHVSFPRNRTLSSAQRAGVHVHRDDFGPDDLQGIATSVERTRD
jgi:hypothetical protein